MKISQKILSLFLTIAMIFTVMPGAGMLMSYADDVNYKVSFAYGGEKVAAGETFDVTLNVSADAENAQVAALHSEITYDSTKLAFVKATAPDGTGLTAYGKDSSGSVRIESYGASQTASSSGASMVKVTFKVLDGVSGSAKLAFASDQSFIGKSGSQNDIKASVGDSLSVDISASNVFDVIFGLPDDGLTWNVLTVNGENVNKSYKGGQTASSVVAVGDTMTFSIKADNGVQYTNVMAYGGQQSNRNFDAFVKQDNEVYTLVMPEKNYKTERYSINATTLKIEDNDKGNIAASLTSEMQSIAPSNNGYGMDQIYPSIEAKFTPSGTARVVRWSYKVSDKGNFSSMSWKDLEYGTANDDGTYSISKTKLPERIYYLYYSGRTGDDRNFGFEFKNTCYVLNLESADETVTSVRTEDDLIKLANAVNNGDPYTGVTVRLENDIKLTNSWTDPIGKDTAHPFSGTFDGNGKTVSGLDIDYKFTDPDNNDSKSANAKCFGLFGCVTGAIKGMALDMAGLIAGDNRANVTLAADTVIKDSYNTGSVELTINHVMHANPTGFIAGVSGIVGRVNGTLNMSNCYNSGALKSAATRYGTMGQLNIKADYLTETLNNCYASDTDPSVTGLKAASLNTGDTDKFKDDETSINGGMPLLIWEKAESSDEKYDVTFDMKDVKGSITVYSDAARTQIIDAASDGKYSLKAGTYYYTAKADGYEDVIGSFSVVSTAVEIEINFRAVVDTTITVSPADAALTLAIGNDAVQPVSSGNGTYKFTLYKREQGAGIGGNGGAKGSDGRFGPNDEVTREQMAVIMYNFTKAMGYDVTGNASLDKFSDNASVDSWAADAMKWAVGAGIMNGNADGTLNPRGTATRAQVATIMMNYVKVLLDVK